MRHKSTRSRKVQDFTTSPSLYAGFITSLRRLLAEDGSFKAQYLAEVIESKLKNEALVPASLRRDRAIQKWLDTEVRNAETNVRLYTSDTEHVLFTGTFHGLPRDVTVGDVVLKARDYIRRTIGMTPDWKQFKGSFSGGASTSIRRGVGVIPRKYLTGTDITETAIQLFLSLSKDVEGMPREFRLVDGNVLFTVPKTSEIDRCAAKEPDLNMYCQKAVGDFFRRCLRRHGIDLNDQTTNQRLAHEGSVTNALATLDLSSASDSVTKQLVLALMPEDWSMLLFDIRSPITHIGELSHENEMISSMGNAFTFELQSLLFWSLARSVAYFHASSGRISVYGDDIIVPTGIVESFTEVLTYFGFTLNPDKSFSDGPFRESCGKHWFAGLDVTPFYIRKVPVDCTDWMLILNSLRRWAEIDFTFICDPRYFDLWSEYSKLIPAPLHGGRDMARRDCLVVPYVRNLSRLIPKQRIDRVSEVSLQDGLYLRWCDYHVNAEREHYEPIRFVEDGPLTLKRTRKSEEIGCPVFPQEIRD